MVIFCLQGDGMCKKIISHLNIAIKLCLLLIAVLFLVGTNNGDEIKVSNNNLNMSLDLRLMAMKVEEDIQNDIYSVKDSYVGSLTGYVANCPLCGGHLACMPSLDVLSGITTYKDDVYGDVRIVASSRNLACGSIIKFDNVISPEPIVAIVLDRGVLGTDIDLLVQYESDAISGVGRRTINYDVLRKGW